MQNIWQPIENLPDNWREMALPNLPALSAVWQARIVTLKDSAQYQDFLARMKRRIAIETGVLERLYTLERGITEILIERGIHEALLVHGSSNRPALEVIELIRDQEAAVEGLFVFVNQQRPLSNSYIKELHQLLTRHQETIEARDQFGRQGTYQFLKGEWKKTPNNPQRPDGTFHFYCPPEQVASQMDQMLQWHLSHTDIAPEVEAAWLHHRFTQIHPFQDGNGRVARCLASLIFIRAGWFPLTITRDERTAYLDALEQADNGDLKPLVQLFGKAQEQALIQGITLSEQALSEDAGFEAALAHAVEKLRVTPQAEPYQQVEAYAEQLFDLTLATMQPLEGRVTQALQNVGTAPLIDISHARSNDQRATYHRYQVIETAKKLDYAANLSSYSSWVCLVIEVKNIRTELLISFHAVGAATTHQGVFAASACAYRRFPGENGEATLIQDMQSLSLSPFNFSYYDGEAALQDRFKDWLNSVIDAGFTYWAKGL